MTKNKRGTPSPKVFGVDFTIPPMFSETFRKSPEWEIIKNIDYETTGKILICLLILEHYVTNLITLLTPEDLNWNGTRMTFNQKITLISKMGAFTDPEFIKGIEIINGIRNKYSHNLLASIAESNIQELKRIIIKFRGRSEIPNDAKNIVVIEAFTYLVCAYIAGYCTALVDFETKKPKALKKKTTKR
jgi:hypothetical protein